MPSSSFVKKYKCLAVEVGWDDYLFWLNAQNIFFQLPKLNKFCLGVELDPAHQVIKKLKMDYFMGLHAVSQFMPQQLQNVIKTKQKGHASY